MPVPEQMQVSLEWVDVESMPITALTNVYTAVNAPNEILLLLGQATAPLFSGTPAQQTAKLRQLHTIKCHPLARLMLSPQRALELIGVLQAALANNAIIVGQGSVTKEETAT